MSDSLLKLDAIGKSFHGVTVLHDASFEVSPGQMLGLVGESGAGKSTLMNIIGGVLLPDAGRMTISGGSYAIELSCFAMVRSLDKVSWKSLASTGWYP